MAILPEFHNPVILPKTPYLDTYAFENPYRKKKEKRKKKDPHSLS